MPTTIINSVNNPLDIIVRQFDNSEMRDAMYQALNTSRGHDHPVFSRMVQVQGVFMGNPGDVNYQDRQFDCLYLGSSSNCWGEMNYFWYCPELMLVAVTFDGDPGRSTWARRIGDGPVETFVSSEQLQVLNDSFNEAMAAREAA